MEGWAKEWELGVEDERTLLLAAADVLRASKKKKAGPVDGYRLALKALATYQVQPWAILPVLLKRALQNVCCRLLKRVLQGVCCLGQATCVLQADEAPLLMHGMRLVLCLAACRLHVATACGLTMKFHSKVRSKSGCDWQMMQGASAAELATVKAAAATVCAEFVRLPDQFQFDLLEADAVSQLRSDPEHGDLYRLLTILLTSASVKVAKPVTFTVCPASPLCWLQPTQFPHFDGFQAQFNARCPAVSLDWQ